MCLCVGSCAYRYRFSIRRMSVFLFQINRIVAEIRAARQKRGNNKYDYDSDEDVEDGTWEHRMRAKEMIETEGRVHVTLV